jgi:flagellar biosynthesis protein FlhG
MNSASHTTRRPRRGLNNRESDAPGSRKVQSVGKTPHVITITSGKGGVGKTNLTANIGWQLRQMRKKVLIMDADLGLANIDILLGLTPDFNLSHVLNGTCSLESILTRGPGGMRILPAGSGVSAVTELTDTQKIGLLSQLENIQQEFDYLLIDTGAGISQNVIYFNLAAQTMLVIVTPEPTSLTDAYALIKVLSRDYHQTSFQILANDVCNDDEGLDVFNKLTSVTDRFLNVSLDYLGGVPHDRAVRDAVRMQRVFCEVFPENPASSSIRKIARAVTRIEHDPSQSDLGLLWRNIIGTKEDTSDVTGS